MPHNPLQILSNDYFEQYKAQQPYTIDKHFKKLNSIEQGNQTFNFYMTGAAVYSSQIEGNRIDFDSFLKYKDSGMNTIGKSYKEIEDLTKAYQFAKTENLTPENALKAHQILSSTFIETEVYRGNLRDKRVGVYGAGQKIYEAAQPEILHQEWDKLFKDINTFSIAGDFNRPTTTLHTSPPTTPLSIDEIFYYAAQIHLTFSHIHPFADGNGRAARLLEKWFLATHLGYSAWFIQSEKMYFKQLPAYYRNIHLGTDYTLLDYSACIPFLKMLPAALKLK